MFSHNITPTNSSQAIHEGEYGYELGDAVDGIYRGMVQQEDGAWVIHWGGKLPVQITKEMVEDAFGLTGMNPTWKVNEIFKQVESSAMFGILKDLKEQIADAEEALYWGYEGVTNKRLGTYVYQDEYNFSYYTGPMKYNRRGWEFFDCDCKEEIGCLVLKSGKRIPRKYIGTFMDEEDAEKTKVDSDFQESTDLSWLAWKKGMQAEGKRNREMEDRGEVLPT